MPGRTPDWCKLVKKTAVMVQITDEQELIVSSADLELLPMVWLAVRRTSSLGQSRKDRLALVPAATLICSFSSPSSLISQLGSEPTLRSCRDRSERVPRSTAHRTEGQGAPGWSLL